MGGAVPQVCGMLAVGTPPEIASAGAGPEGVMRVWPQAREAPKQEEKMTKKISHFLVMARFFLSKRGQRVDNGKFPGRVVPAAMNYGQGQAEESQYFAVFNA